MNKRIIVAIFLVLFILVGITTVVLVFSFDSIDSNLNNVNNNYENVTPSIEPSIVPAEPTREMPNNEELKETYVIPMREEFEYLPFEITLPPSWALIKKENLGGDTFVFSKDNKSILIDRGNVHSTECIDIDNPQVSPDFASEAFYYSGTASQSIDTAIGKLILAKSSYLTENSEYLYLICGTPFLNKYEGFSTNTSYGSFSVKAKQLLEAKEIVEVLDILLTIKEI